MYQLMSWLRREFSMLRLLVQHEKNVDVESSEMRKAVGLGWYLTPGDERMDAEELGRRIDDCLVEAISDQLLNLKEGDSSIKEFNSRMRKFEEGMKEDPDLKAFAATFQRPTVLPLASETYLDLARRHALSDGKPPPSPEEGRRFALALLDDVMIEGLWEWDWDRLRHIGGLADWWLDSRDPAELQKLIHDSEKSPVSWDVLKRICQELAGRGEEDPPRELLQWYFGATHGHPERPDEGPAPSHRPQKLGYKIRNNEIRHTVDLLAQVGMTKNDGHCAVAEAFHFSEIRISRICQEPYFTFKEFAEDATKRLEPSYHSFLYGPGSNSDPSSSP